MAYYVSVIATALYKYLIWKRDFTICIRLFNTSICLITYAHIHFNF